LFSKFGIIRRLIRYYATPGRTFAADDIIVSRGYSVSKAEVNGILLTCGERVFACIGGSDRVVVLNGDIATIVPALKLLTAREWSKRIQQKVPITFTSAADCTSMLLSLKAMTFPWIRRPLYLRRKPVVRVRNIPPADAH
jgi:hypothetical protein